jgi:hypothetical protein
MTRLSGRAVAVLALTFAVHAWGIDWGLPGEYGWAPDEVLPQAVTAAWEQRFAGGWHEKYPPLHYALMGVVHGPVRLASRWLGWAGPRQHYALFLAGRALSLAMAAGTILLVYLCGRRLDPPGEDDLGAAFAALLAGLSVPFVFYAKLANLDVPYLFWFAFALLFYVRVLEAHRLRDYVLFAVVAAASVATKDQAYALYLLVPFAVLPSLRRRLAAEGAPGGWGATLRDRRPWLALVAGAAAFVMLDNVLFNLSGFRAHLRVITGAASTDFRMFAPTAAGQLALLVRTLRDLSFSLGGPAFLACLLGIAASLLRFRQDARRLALLVPAVSYYAGFLAVVLYTYDRFVLPLCLVLAFFGGQALAEGWRLRGAARIPARLAVAAVLAVCLARAVSVDLVLRGDSRYAAEAWLRGNASAADLVAAVGPLEYLPRLDGLRWRRLGPSVSRLVQVHPDVVVVNADHAARSEPGTADRELYDGLADGRLGYRLAHREDARPGHSWIDPARLRAEGTGASNLDKVSPTILVYRHDTSAPRGSGQE